LTALHGPFTTVVVDVGAGRIVHWGASLGPLDASQLEALANATMPAVPQAGLDRHVAAGLVPDPSVGWVGAPSIQLSRNAIALQPRWQPVVDDPSTDLASDDGAVTVRLGDPAAGVLVEVRLRLVGDVLVSALSITNTGVAALGVERAAVVLPVGSRGAEIESFAGRWSREFISQRIPVSVGQWVRENVRGRTSHDAFPGVLVGTSGFSEERGDIWAAHLAWSGNHRTVVERLADGRTVMQLGELLSPGEVVLAPGDTYDAPPVHACWSGTGRNGVRRAMHRFMRARTTHPQRPRPVLLNTWEAVYFDHQLSKLFNLAERAAEVGVERFVLDDGWFGKRDDDTTSLADWVVDARKYPNGLAPLADYVNGLGMEFGLWVEPEMVNPDSDIARAHPEWILQTPGYEPVLGRSQLVLDLQHADVADYLFERLDELLRTVNIAYFKWDMNRDHTHGSHHGRPSAHGQTLAVYALLDRLRAAHPSIEIESCASGGGRIDHGILARTDRVWTSDCNDALERQRMHQGATLFVPPELLGAHIGPRHSHTTGRVHGIEFRALTALPFHLGIEWNIAAINDADRARLAELVAFHRRHRDLLHHGELRWIDVDDPSIAAYGVIAEDRSQAVVVVAQLDTSTTTLPTPIVISGLDAASTYSVRPVHELAPAYGPMKQQPPWWKSGVNLNGAALGSVGVTIPVLNPETAVVIELTRQ
jgi:alpha-galactosidase